MMNAPDTTSGIVCLALALPVGRAIDQEQIARTLDEALGEQRWMVLSEWLFRPPARPSTLPVLTPLVRDSATAGRLSDLAISHWPSRSEIGGWRMVAAKVYPWAEPLGAFPWEIAELAKGH